MSPRRGWEATLRHRVAIYHLMVAGDRVLGRASPQAEQARLHVVDAIDAAAAAGVGEPEIDAVLADASPGTMEP